MNAIKDNLERIVRYYKTGEESEIDTLLKDYKNINQLVKDRLNVYEYIKNSELEKLSTNEIRIIFWIIMNKYYSKNRGWLIKEIKDFIKRRDYIIEFRENY